MLVFFKHIVSVLVITSVILSSMVFTASASEMASDEVNDVFYYNGHSYMLIDENLSWDEAKTYCENLGGHLATITSLNEQNFIKKLLTGSKSLLYYLGGLKNTSIETWSWITGERFQYTNWDMNFEPHILDEYLLIASDRINDETFKKVLDAIDYELKDIIPYLWYNYESSGLADAILDSAFGFICEWDYKENYNIIKKKVLQNSFTIKVNALSASSNNEMPAYGAEVSIYLGDTEIYNEKTNSQGIAKFNLGKIDQFDAEYIIKNATVSARLEAGDGVVLCSEEVKPNGSWQKAKLSTVMNNDKKYLVVDEPRWYVPTLRVMINNSDIAKCEGILRESSRLFAQATNGHVIVNQFEIVNVPNAYKLKKKSTLKEMSCENNIDICMVNHWSTGAEAQIPIIEKSYSYTQPGTKSTVSPYYQGDEGLVWCPVNTYGCARTLCHEFGHYLLGFLDEYASAIGAYMTWLSGFESQEHYDEYNPKGYNYMYAFDVNYNRRLEANEKNAAKWKGKIGGTVERPSYAPPNFGIMEAELESIEMSRADTYKGVNVNEVSEQTLQYYILQASCEEKLVYELEEKSANYGVDYTEAPETQDAWYDYAGGDNVIFSYSRIGEERTVLLHTQSAVDTYTEPLSDMSSENLGGFDDGCIFFYSNGTLQISTDKTVEIALCDINGYEVYSSLIDESNGYTSMLELETDTTYTLYVYGEDDGASCSNEYTVDTSILKSVHDLNNHNESINLFGDGNAESAVISKYRVGEMIHGDYISLTHEYNILTDTTEETSGYLDAVVSFGLPIDYSSMTWFVKKNYEWIALETLISTAEHGNPEVSCDYSGDGIYCLMAKEASETVLDVPADFAVTTDNTIYDGEVNISFTDSNENVLYYNVYYGTEEITSENYTEMNVQIVDAGSSKASILLDDSNTAYYFAIQVVGADGGKSEISENVSCKGALLDSDSDGIPDEWINTYSVLADLEDIAGTDNDEDGLTNLEEYKIGTNPVNPDTDGDNVYDYAEWWNDLNPFEPMTDGITDDYIVLYGTPDVRIDENSFRADAETGEVSVSIVNDTESKAMRTTIYLYVGDELVDACFVNLDTNSSVEYTFSSEYLVDGMRIVVDEGRITRDKNYSNNEFDYVPINGINSNDSEIIIVKGSTCQLSYKLSPTDASKIIMWDSSDESVVSVNNNGLITALEYGEASIVATTLTGLSCHFKISVRSYDSIGIVISQPNSRTLYYGETIKLYAYTSELPDGYRVKWSFEGTGVKINSSYLGNSCEVTSTSTGNVVIKAYVVDSNGNLVKDENNELIYDSEYFYSEANLWLRIVYFFRKMFGISRTIVQSIYF